MVKVKQLYQKNWRDPYEVETIVKKHLHGYSLNMPCGMSKLGNVKADIDKKVNPDIEVDMFNPPFERSCFDSIYCDPPWGINIMKRRRLAIVLTNLLKPVTGTLIFNCNWILMNKVLRLKEVYFITSDNFGSISAITIYDKPNKEILNY